MSINPLELFLLRKIEAIKARLKDYTKAEKLTEITRFLDERSITTITAQELYDALVRTPDAIAREYSNILQELMKDDLEEIEDAMALETKQDDIIASLNNIVTASDTLLLSSDGIVQNSTGIYTKCKEFMVLLPGNYRIKFGLRNTSDASERKGRIYKNGVAYGTERLSSEDVNVWVVFSEDLLFGSEDLLQLYSDGVGVDVIEVRNFRVYGTMSYGVGSEQTV